MPLRRANPQRRLEAAAGPLDELFAAEPSPGPEKPVISHYVNPAYRLDQEMRKRGFRKLQDVNSIPSWAGNQPVRGFKDYRGPVYVKPLMEHGVSWWHVAWIATPEGPVKTYGAYYSDSPATSEYVGGGATMDEAIDALLRRLDLPEYQPGPREEAEQEEEEREEREEVSKSEKPEAGETETERHVARILPVLGSVVPKEGSGPEFRRVAELHYLSPLENLINQKLLPLRDRLRLPDIVVQEAFSLVKRVTGSREDFADRRGRTEAIVFIACRLHGLQCRPEDLIEASGIRTVKPLVLTSLAYEIANSLGIDIAPPDYRKMILGVVDRLKVRPIYQDILSMFEQARRIMPGVNPRGLIASILYLALRPTEYRITEPEAADLFGMTTYTVREVSLKLRHLMGEKVSKKIVEKMGGAIQEA